MHFIDHIRAKNIISHMRDKQSASRSPFLREEKALTTSLSPEKSFFLILPIALRLRLINRGGFTMPLWIVRGLL